MRMKKRVTIVCLLWVLVGILAGCGTKKEDKEEPMELISRMVEAAAEGAVVTQSVGKAELKIHSGDELTGMDTTMFFEAKNKYDKASVGAASEITIHENDLEDITVKFNLVDEQGVLYHYAWDESNGWGKYEACFEKDDMARNFVSTMNLENAEMVGLETEGILVEDKEAYKLSLKLKDAQIRELLFETGIKNVIKGREYASIDLSDTTVAIDYYVDPETAQVLKVEAKMEGMKNFLREWLEFYYGENAAESLGAINITECAIVYDHISYEDLKLPRMSFEDKKNSVYIPQQDSVYAMNMLECKVDITWLKGWYATTQDKHLLRLRKNTSNGTILRTYAMDINMDEQEIREGYIDSTIEAFKEADLYVSEQDGPDFGVFKTYEILLKNGVISIAYTKIDNCWLIIVVVDYTSSRLDKSLPEVLESVTWE